MKPAGEACPVSRGRHHYQVVEDGTEEKGVMKGG